MSVLGGIGLGLNFLGGIAGNIMNRRAIQEQNKANKELAKYQYDLNMQAWHQQNEYNSPTNQVARLARAGLNPQLAYGNGQQAGNAGTPPQFQAPHMEAYQGNANDMAQMFRMEQILALKQSEAQINLLDKQAEKEEAMAWHFDTLAFANQRSQPYFEEVNKANAQWHGELLSLQASQGRMSIAEQSLRIEHMEQAIRNMNTQQQGMLFDNLSKQIDAAYRGQLNEAEIKRLRATAAQLGASANYLDGQLEALRKLTPEQINQLKATVRQMEQNININGPLEEAALNGAPVSKGIGINELPGILWLMLGNGLNRALK